MIYLPIAIFAHLLNGFSLIVDKTLMDHQLKSPFVYTFYIGLLSILAILLIPFGFYIPQFIAVVYAISSGIVYIVALLAFFKSLQSSDLTVVSPIVGTLNPVFALILGFTFLNEQFSQNQLTAFGLLILGSIILTFNLWWRKHSFNKNLIYLAASGFFFGLSYVLLREAFLQSSFISGLVLSRVAMVGTVILFLFTPKIRWQISASRLTKNHFMSKTGLLVLGGQLAGGLSGFLVAFAVSLASPAVVNSLHGLQYIMLLLIAVFLSKSHPNILDEQINRKTLGQKIFATLLISLGLFYLVK